MSVVHTISISNKKGEGAVGSPRTTTMKVKQRFSSLLLAAILCICSLAVPAFAAGNTGYGTAVFGGNTQTENIQPGSDQTPSSNSGSSFEDAFGVKDPNVTTDDVNNWVDRKGSELISIITRGVRIVSLIGFFISLLLIIIGAVGNKRTMVGGLIGLIIACVCFTAATMGPQIMNAVQSWLMH